MNNHDVLTWIKKNLSPYILRSIQMHPGTFVTEAIMAGIVCRETGELIARYAAKCPSVLEMASLMKGDYTKRVRDAEKKYHGFGFTQIDVDSYKWFVDTHAWQDPNKCFSQSIAILEGNKKYIVEHNPSLKGSPILEQAAIAAYNCGAGNENKDVAHKLDLDAYTTGHDYSKSVLQFAEIYKTIQ